MHRDGVDYVLVLLDCAGTTSPAARRLIHAPTIGIGSFTLAEPLDAALVDDARVFHGVTPVQAVDPNQPAYRDVLVVTFKRLPPQLS